jgi:hypothetical protein
MTVPVKVYHSGQPGAPQISGQAGTRDAVLYACLASGFGSMILDSITQSGGVATATRATGLNLADGVLPTRAVTISGANEAAYNGEFLAYDITATTFKFAIDPAAPASATGTLTAKAASAGWAREFTDTYKSVYRPTDMTGSRPYLRIDDSNDRYALVRGYEAMDDVDTGTGPFPTEAQMADGLYWGGSNVASAATRPWILIVDAFGFYLFVAWSTSWPNYEPSYFGDIISFKPGDAYRGAIIGNTALPVAPAQFHGFASKNGASQAGQYLARDSAGASGAIPFTKTGNAFSSTLGNTVGPPAFNPPDAAIHTNGPIYLSEGTTNNGTPLRGVMPLLRDVLNGAHLDALDRLTDIPNLPGRTLLIVRAAHSTSIIKPAFDITGPRA